VAPTPTAKPLDSKHNPFLILKDAMNSAHIEVNCTSASAGKEKNVSISRTQAISG